MVAQVHEHAGVWVLPPTLTPTRLGTTWQVVEQRQTVTFCMFYDTFEWGVWFSGHLLYNDGSEYVLQTFANGWPDTVESAEQGGNRRFWYEFSNTLMRRRLRVYLGLRGLEAVATGAFTTQYCDLRNESGKIVCRLEWSCVADEPGKDPYFASCKILPLRGYEDQTSHVVDRLVELGATPPATGPFSLLLQRAGRTPRVYTLKPSFAISFETPAREAVGRIIATILTIAESNRAGIIADLDTEFLHDYRICLRKARSLLGLVKNVYPAGETERFRNQLGEYARATNRLRDLDVYSLTYHDHLENLPEPLHKGLSHIFSRFSAERKREQRRISTHLQEHAGSPPLNGIIAEISNISEHDDSAAAFQPIGPLVFKGILKRYRKIKACAETITPETNDETLHYIRIECKKLRYLMEFFNEILPPDESQPLQKQLRRLQGALGDFNDSSVQQEFLLGWWHKHQAATESTLAMGGLLALLHQRRQEARLQIDKMLREFTDTSTAATFKRIFKLKTETTGK